MQGAMGRGASGTFKRRKCGGLGPRDRLVRDSDFFDSVLELAV